MIKITLRQVFFYTVGAFCIALALQMFHSPNDIVAGGVSGLGIILLDLSENYLGFGIPLWFTNVAVNVPLLIASYRIRGKDILIRSGIVVALLSFFLWALGFYTFKPMDVFISSIMGAIIMGFGLGLIFRNNATSGGTDLLAAVITKIFPAFSLSKTLFVIDASIIVFGFLVFGIEKGLYGIAAVYACTKVIDFVMIGGNAAKSTIIITDKPKEVSERIWKEVNRGVTAFYGKGMYTNQDKMILYCVAHGKQIVRIKQILKEIDPNAFITIGDVHEVVGEGFARYDENSL
ncbi:MAG: YitT family protein [Lachnospirales bacterium]